MLTYSQRRMLVMSRRANRAQARELLAKMKTVRFWIDLILWPVSPCLCALLVAASIGAMLGMTWLSDRVVAEYVCQKKVGK